MHCRRQAVSVCYDTMLCVVGRFHGRLQRLAESYCCPPLSSYHHRGKNSSAPKFLTHSTSNATAYSVPRIKVKMERAGIVLPVLAGFPLTFLRVVWFQRLPVTELRHERITAWWQKSRTEPREIEEGTTNQISAFGQQKQHSYHRAPFDHYIIS